MNKRIMTLTLLFAMFMVSSQGLTALQRSIYLFDKGMSADTYGYLLFMGAGLSLAIQTFLGPWSDRGPNRKTSIIVGTAILNAAGIFGFAAFQNMVALSVSLVFAVIGFGTSFNMMRTLTASLSNPDTTSTNFARLQLTCGGSYAVFAAIYGYILDRMGFSGLFVIASGLTIAAIFVSVLLWIGVSKIEQPVDTEPKRKSLLSAYSFDRKVMVIMGLYLFISITQYGGFNYILYYMKEVGGTSDKLAGWILSVAGIIEIPMMYFAGRYCKTHNKERLIIPFLLIGASRWILLLFVSNPIWFFPIHSMRTFLLSAMFIAVGALVMDYVPTSRAGAALGMLGSIASIGQAVGPAIMGAIVDGAGVRTGMVVMAAMLIIPTILFTIYLLKDTDSRKALLGTASD